MLTDKQCKNALCPADHPRERLADAGGLYLEVAPSGSKRWFWKYRFDGKEKRLALGSYPAAMCSIPSDKMKRTKQEKVNGRPHCVPLPSQAVSALKDLHPLTGRGSYVFPSLQSVKRPMSENTVRVALRRLGFDNDTMTPHGFRAMARTIMVERLNVVPEVIEAQLAHGKSGPLGAWARR